MPTRRQVLEAELVEQRKMLWSDLSSDIGRSHPLSGNVSGRIDRIRACCVALGYPSDWRTIPVTMLGWWELVETIPDASIEPRPTDWPDLLAYLTDSEREFQEVPDEAITAYGSKRSYPMMKLTQGDRNDE